MISSSRDCSCNSVALQQLESQPLTQAGHDRGWKVLEDTVFVLKESSYSGIKKGIYVTPAWT